MGLIRKEVPSGPPVGAGSLAEALGRVPEPRRPSGWSPGRSPLPLVGILQVAMAATLCGARSLYAIAPWPRERVEDRPEALVAWGQPAGRRPSVATLQRIFKGLDGSAFEDALGGWLAQTGVQPVEAVALDRKPLRGIHGDTVPGVQLVAASAHGAGEVLAQVAAPGTGQALAAVKALLAELPRAGRVVTGAALLTQRAICERVVAAGGADRRPVDENQPTLKREVAEAFSPLADACADRPRRRRRRPTATPLAE